jgi:hypothetical protein
MIHDQQQLEEYQRQVAEFLAQGGEVHQVVRGKSGYVEGQSRSAWGAPRKKAAGPVKAAAKKG